MKDNVKKLVQNTKYYCYILAIDIHLLSKSRILNCVLELKDELNSFFEAEKPEYSYKLKDDVWCADLAYLADIFNKLNTTNSSMQDKKETLISARDKMNRFGKKLELWM